MSQIERLYRLKSLLDSGRCLTPERLLAELGMSSATLNRVVQRPRLRVLRQDRAARRKRTGRVGCCAGRAGWRRADQFTGQPADLL